MAGYDLFVWNMGKKTAHHQNSRMNSTGKCRYGRAFCLDYAPGFLLWQPDELHIGPLLGEQGPHNSSSNISNSCISF
ncbi:hypothetical protein V6N12_068867 [Hibiscus sabdariffa]|uniref:Uncharacterized protein n=1 Tax=Hibiscus sabdariffa TaxID=183260 RepID=A0ABR2CA33_9ROSI